MLLSRVVLPCGFPWKTKDLLALHYPGSFCIFRVRVFCERIKDNNRRLTQRTQRNRVAMVEQLLYVLSFV